jgi:hypothetical protein
LADSKFVGWAPGREHAEHPLADAMKPIEQTDFFFARLKDEAPILEAHLEAGRQLHRDVSIWSLRHLLDRTANILQLSPPAAQALSFLRNQAASGV